MSEQIALGPFDDVIALIAAIRTGRKKTAARLAVSLLASAVELLPDDPPAIAGAAAASQPKPLTDEGAILELQALCASQGEAGAKIDWSRLLTILKTILPLLLAL